MAAAQSPLRRWKPFFATFDAIDAAIVASDPSGLPGDELQCARVLRHAKVEVVELLCDASEDDAAEEFCRILDEVMVEYLVTLKSVPAASSALASADLAKAVGALREHESERIRGLARDIICRYESLASVVPVAAVDGEKTASVVRSGRVEPAKSDVPAKVSAPPLSKKSANQLIEAEKMESTKRKLHEGYKEAADAKRQRRIQVIEAPKLPEQRQRMVLKERSRARCAGSTALRRSLMPAFCRV